jgi:hypothetical protein
VLTGLHTLDVGFGRAVMLQVPGADDVMPYEPRQPTADDL